MEKNHCQSLWILILDRHNSCKSTRFPTENGKKCGVSFKPVSSSFRNLKRTLVLTIKKIMVVVIVMTTTILSSIWKIMLRNLWGENCSGFSQICGSMCVAMKLAASPVPCRWCIINCRLSMHYVCCSSNQQNPSHYQQHRHLSSISVNLWQSLAVDVNILHSNNFWRML